MAVAANLKKTDYSGKWESTDAHPKLEEVSKSIKMIQLTPSEVVQNSDRVLAIWGWKAKKDGEGKNVDVLIMYDHPEKGWSKLALCTPPLRLPFGMADTKRFATKETDKIKYTFDFELDDLGGKPEQLELMKAIRIITDACLVHAAANAKSWGLVKTKKADPDDLTSVAESIPLDYAEIKLAFGTGLRGSRKDKKDETKIYPPMVKFQIPTTESGEPKLTVFKDKGDGENFPPLGPGETIPKFSFVSAMVWPANLWFMPTGDKKVGIKWIVLQARVHEALFKHSDRDGGKTPQGVRPMWNDISESYKRKASEAPASKKEDEEEGESHKRQKVENEGDASCTNESK